jgi:hypothetical protein
VIGCTPPLALNRSHPRASRRGNSRAEDLWLAVSNVVFSKHGFFIVRKGCSAVHGQGLQGSGHAPPPWDGASSPLPACGFWVNRTGNRFHGGTEDRASRRLPRTAPTREDFWSIARKPSRPHQPSRGSGRSCISRAAQQAGFSHQPSTARRRPVLRRTRPEPPENRPLALSRLIEPAALISRAAAAAGSRRTRPEPPENRPLGLRRPKPARPHQPSQPSHQPSRAAAVLGGLGLNRPKTARWPPSPETRPPSSAEPRRRPVPHQPSRASGPLGGLGLETTAENRPLLLAERRKPPGQRSECVLPRRRNVGVEVPGSTITSSVLPGRAALRRSR